MAMGWRSRAQRVAMTGESRAVITVAVRRRFFAAIVKHLRDRLPQDFRRFSHRGDFNLLKIWWDNPRVHFEVVIDQQIDRIEVGLHFEDGPVSTIAYLHALESRVLELKHELGHELELERWTTSWGRIYELSPLETIDDKTTKRIARRVERFIVVLQPIVVAADVPPERSANR